MVAAVSFEVRECNVNELERAEGCQVRSCFLIISWVEVAVEKAKYTFWGKKEIVDLLDSFLKQAVTRHDSISVVVLVTEHDHSLA